MTPVDAASGLPEVNLQVARMIRGQREARGLSLTQAAARAGLSKTILAKIESGAGNPSLETLWRIARALDLTLGSLLNDEDPLRARVVRPAESDYVFSESGVRTRAVYTDGRGRRTELLEMAFEPGVEYRSAPHAPGTEELVFCIDGALELGPEGRQERLGSRDAMHFTADVPHRYRSDEGCLALCILSYPAAVPPT